MKVDPLRRALPAVVLLASLVASGAGAFQAHVAQRSHRATAEALLGDYGAFAASAYRERAAAAAASTVRRILYPVRQDMLGDEPPTECLARVLARASAEEGCACEPGARSQTTGFAFVVRPTGGGAHYVGEPPPPAERTALEERVAAEARNAGEYGLVEVPGGPAGSRLVAWARVERGADTAVYGAEVPPERLASLLVRTFESHTLLPGSLAKGAANRDMLALSVTLSSGRTLYASVEEGDAASAGPAGGDTWPASLGGGVVRAAVLPGMADRLIIGGLPGNRVPWMLLVFALSAGVALVAVVYLRRDALLARQRNDFVASVSHELRTPLAQVRLFVETLRLRRVESEEQREWALATIDRETLRLSRLVENVLSFSRAERGIQQQEPELVVLRDETLAAVDAFRPLLRPGQAAVRVDVPERFRVEVDRDAFRQVLLNLLDNAVKYGPAGQTVRVVASGRGSEVELAIEDEGPGVPASEREAVWEPFSRGTAAVGSVVVGSGIGLSVVRALVRDAGGRCRVEDAATGGARFVVTLPSPLTAAAPRQEALPAAPLRATTAEVA